MGPTGRLVIPPRTLHREVFPVSLHSLSPILQPQQLSLTEWRDSPQVYMDSMFMSSQTFRMDASPPDLTSTLSVRTMVVQMTKNATQEIWVILKRVLVVSLREPSLLRLLVLPASSTWWAEVLWFMLTQTILERVDTSYR